MSTATPMKVSKQSQEIILKMIRAFKHKCDNQLSLRGGFRQTDLSYLREFDLSDDTIKSRVARVLHGDPTKFRNMVMPIVMPQVEQAVAGQVATFLTGVPIFSAVANPGMEDAALAMDAVIQDQQTRGGWVSELIIALRNGFKYELMAVEVDWERRVTWSPQGEKDLREVNWQGNRLRSLDMYNVYMDPDVPPRYLATEGEFAGFMEMKTRVGLYRLLRSLPRAFNHKQAYASNLSQGEGMEFYIPELNFDLFQKRKKTSTTAEFDWYSWAGLLEDGRRTVKDYKGKYLVDTVYARVMPSDLGITGVPGANTPQVWKFIVVNMSVVIYCERMTNAHDMLGIVFGQPLMDGLDYQTKSFANNLEPIQELTSAISNLSIAARRRAVGDRIAYDRSRVSSGHMESELPISRIPVKPSAAGTPVGNAFYQFPFEDSQFQFNQAELSSWLQVGDQVSGLNQARQGQFVKGNKTRFEFATVMGNAGARDYLISLGLEATFFQPIKEIIKLNILQYQQTGTVWNSQQQRAIEVDPVQLREAGLQFKMADGLTPADKLVDGETVEAALTAMTQNPAFGQGYNLTPMFSYLMKTRGADLTPFEKSREQIAYEEAMHTWQQTILQAAQTLQAQIAKSENPQELLQQLQQALPPQPKPEDYGYSPTGNTVQPQEPTSVLQQVIQATQGNED